MSNIYETLVERGIIAQCTNEEKVKEILDHEQVPFYVDMRYAGEVALRLQVWHESPYENAALCSS